MSDITSFILYHLITYKHAGKKYIGLGPATQMRWPSPTSGLYSTMAVAMLNEVV